MRSIAEIDRHAMATKEAILRESKGISEKEAELLAYRGICRYENLDSIRETPLALQIIHEYAERKGVEVESLWR